MKYNEDLWNFFHLFIVYLHFSFPTPIVEEWDGMGIFFYSIITSPNNEMEILFQYVPFHFDSFYSIPSLSINLNKTLFKGKYTFIIFARFRDKHTYGEYFQREKLWYAYGHVTAWYCH